MHLVCEGMLSERRACGLVRLSRSVARYVSRRSGDEDLHKQLKELAERFPASQKTDMKLRFIQTGKPIQNVFVESFNGRFRDTCLNEYWFSSPADARHTTEARRRHYNEERPP